MERLDPRTIADALMAAPGWARVGIAAPSENLRTRSVQELALSIAEHLDGIPRAPHPDQLTFFP